MTKVLKLALLGPLRLTINEEPLADLASAKAQGLLCYLALNGRVHSRQTLAGLLWGELPEADARRNLRGALLKLRQQLEPYLHVTHQAIAFNREAPYWLDVEAFAQGVDGRGHATPDLEQLKASAALYRGDFLDDFHLRQAPEFESWLAQQRTEWREKAIVIFNALARQLGERGELAAGIAIARRLVNLDDTRESSQRRLMALLAANGQRAAALAQLEQYRRWLQAELGVDVSEQTAELAEQIRRQEWPASRLARPAAAPPAAIAPSVPPLPAPPPFIAGPPITHPARFFGREREMRRLFNLLRQRPLQNAAIIGPKRSGKTSLLHYLKAITTIPPDQLRPGQTQAWLADPARYRWVFVDFQDSRMGSCATLLRYLLAQMALPVPDTCDLETFLDQVSAQLHTPTIIMFDEIGVAIERHTELDDAFWEGLRSLATNLVDGHLGFMLASHEPPDALAQHQGLGSPFFNIFGYTAVLGPLSEEAARELIASSPLPFSTADTEWILEQSQRWPMPLQILCRERLVALEAGESGAEWQTDALRQIAPFLPV